MTKFERGLEFQLRKWYRLAGLPFEPFEEGLNMTYVVKLYKRNPPGDELGKKDATPESDTHFMALQSGPFEAASETDAQSKFAAILGRPLAPDERIEVLESY